MITNIELDNIELIISRATPGPWMLPNGMPFTHHAYDGLADREFIAVARKWMPLLVEDARRHNRLIDAIDVFFNAGKEIAREKA